MCGLYNHITKIPFSLVVQELLAKIYEYLAFLSDGPNQNVAF